MAKAFGKYVLLRRLATGGMGEVFLARPAEVGRGPPHLVIKRILPHLAEDAELRALFLNEARIAAQLHHPNLIEIFEVGEVGESIYLAMEHVHGEDVRRIERAARAQGRRVPLGAAVRIIAAAAAGLEHAHGLAGQDGTKLDLVHRDVSPQNLLVGFGGEVKLIDFGVAKATGHGQHTAAGFLKGKCAYMSPEQAAGEPLDARSDVFSLGVVFWELLTGRRLFKGSSDPMTMRLVLGCQVPRPSKVDPALPQAVDAVALGALARKPTDRYLDARVFRRALESLVEPEVLLDAPPPHASLVRELFPERWRQSPEDLAQGSLVQEEEISGISSMRRAGNAPKGGGGRWQAFAAEDDEHTLTLSAVTATARGRRIVAAVAVALALGALALLLR